MVERITQTAIGISLDAFVEQYAEQPFELINGDRITLSPNIAGHQWIAQLLYELLKSFTSAHNFGFVAFETPFVLEDRADWVTGSRTPDLMVYRMARRTAYREVTPDWKDKPYVLVPDLAIEIVSPNDRYSQVHEKAENYLSDGVQLVWIVDPQRAAVTIYMAGSSQQTTLHAADTLTGSDVLPGFSVVVRRLFED